MSLKHYNPNGYCKQKVQMKKKVKAVTWVCLAYLKDSTCLLYSKKLLRRGGIIFAKTHYGVRPK